MPLDEAAPLHKLQSTILDCMRTGETAAGLGTIERFEGEGTVSAICTAISWGRPATARAREVNEVARDTAIKECGYDAVLEVEKEEWNRGMCPEEYDFIDMMARRVYEEHKAADAVTAFPVTAVSEQRDGTKGE